MRDRAGVLAASHQTQKRRAPGLDHGTAPQSAARRDEHLRDLPARLRDHREVAPPVARVWIEKDDAKTRPLGQPCCADKSVQRAVGMSLAALVAQDFHACSPGCRTGHRPQHARHARREPGRTGPIHWRVDAEGRGWVDHLAWSPLRECIPQRGSAGGRRRRSGTWRHAGVREAGALRPPDKGTPPGGGSAPLCAKVFLPHVLDEWCGKDVRPRRQGHGFLTRCADDGSIGCEREAEARRMLAVRPKRFTRCRRPMHPEQTALMACKRPPSRERAAGRTGPCDVLGLTP